MTGRSEKFNQKLAIVILLIVAVLTMRLGFAASATQNWRGFIYSFLHILIVAGGTYLAIKEKRNEN